MRKERKQSQYKIGDDEVRPAANCVLQALKPKGVSEGWSGFGLARYTPPVNAASPDRAVDVVIVLSPVLVLPFIASLVCLDSILCISILIMDSPAIPVPLDPQEQPILERLLHIRDALLLLKQDKSSYIKSRDVLPYYEEVIAEVDKVNAARTDPDRRLVHNRR